MPWIISEKDYKPALQGIEFSLTDGSEHIMFLMSAKAVADYFHVKHSRDEIMATFAAHQNCIAKFAARVKDNCPMHKNGSRLLSLEVCEAMSL